MADGTTADEITLPSPCAAGIYTSQNLIPLTATIFESSSIPLENLVGFCSEYGRKFYGYPAKEGEEVTIVRTDGEKVVEKAFRYEKDQGGDEWVIPFMAGEKIGWEIERK
jgi:dihydroorotase